MMLLFNPKIRDLYIKKEIFSKEYIDNFLVDYSLRLLDLIVDEIQIYIEQKNLTIIKKIPISKAFNVEKFVIIEKPSLEWQQVGGLAKGCIPGGKPKKKHRDQKTYKSIFFHFPIFRFSRLICSHSNPFLSSPRRRGPFDANEGLAAGTFRR